ncbi:HAD-superfamily subfamily IB hydrolase, TIGR01490 [Thiothrix eikelboomii]|uniref:HAD-superfamily subfamily IB hydrolase, TIGR01490 n=1 Tax=Thiothrix eikelboomii TaxID=92487 RepID=A0A1T4X543_9GAMM|nr:HAD family hydrolase [Thiothrix eikelboomii]SKA84238.1 HAD-superfamily subfamily IB hydrolase, TIGR01490 [Thiothrix eikelboomii]
MTLALFDLDNTLLKGDSDYQWGEFLVRKGLVDAKQHAETNRRFYGQYTNGTLNIHEYAAFTFKFLSDHSKEQLDQWRQEYLQEDVQQMIPAAARALVEKHRTLGHTLVIITATNSFVTRPIATEFGIEHLLAVEPKMENGRYTTEIDGIPTFREGKIERLKAWLQGRAETLEGSYFYSDSHNDLPLLEIVDYPTAVDPDDILRAKAIARGWPIISLRS